MTKLLQIIGLGYIGLPTALVTSSSGINTIGNDDDHKYLEEIKKCEIKFNETGLQEILPKVLASKMLSLSKNIKKAEIFLIVVPTPIKENNIPDLSHVNDVIDKITPKLKFEDLVIIESTCPVGTTNEMYKRILKKRPELKNKFYMAYCPERVIPGNILNELINNDRVIGGINNISSVKARDFYTSFVKGDIHLTDSKTAELCKLTENSSRDSQIAFANEISIISDKYEVNPWRLIELANKHPRVNILNPSPGVGGHCIAIDPWFLASSFKSGSGFIESGRKTNLFKTNWCAEKILYEINSINPGGNNVNVALMGLSYKPNVDDLRESPSLIIYEKLLKSTKAKLMLVEPNIRRSNSLNLYSFSKAYEIADIVVWLVNHNVFETKKLYKSSNNN